MNRYRLTLRVSTFGIGDILRLTPEQFASRAESLDIIKDKRRKNGGHVDVRVIKPIEFKAGEIVELSALPKHLAASAIDLDASDADESKPDGEPIAAYIKEATAEYESSDALKSEFASVDAYVEHRLQERTAN